jgi:LysM repeat protein
MQKFNHFVKYSLGYIVICIVSLVSLYFYLENISTIRDKKDELAIEVEESLKSSLPQLALAQSRTEATPKPEVAGTNTEKKQLVYTVQMGDFLWKIAQKYYGDGYKAFDIAKFNDLKGLDSLNVGQNITLPNIYDTSNP